MSFNLAFLTGHVTPSTCLAQVLSSTGVVLVGDLRVAPLFGDAILVVPGPWLVKEGIGAEGVLTGLVGIVVGCSP
jgi:hypothetical protein